MILFSVLSVDAMDVSGESQIDVISNIYKQRLDVNGNPMAAEAEIQGMISILLRVKYN